MCVCVRGAGKLQALVYDILPSALEEGAGKRRSECGGLWEVTERGEKECVCRRGAGEGGGDREREKERGRLGLVLNTELSPAISLIVQELCESRGGRPGLSVLTSLLVSVDVKNY